MSHVKGGKTQNKRKNQPQAQKKRPVPREEPEAAAAAEPIAASPPPPRQTRQRANLENPPIQRRLLVRIIRRIYLILRLCCFCCTYLHGIEDAIEENERFHDEGSNGYSDSDRPHGKAKIPTPVELTLLNAKRFRAWFNRRSKFTRTTLISLSIFLTFYVIQSILGYSVFRDGVNKSAVVTLIVIFLSSLVITPLLAVLTFLVYAFWNIINTYWCRRIAVKCCCDLPGMCLPPCCCSGPRYICRKCCCCV